MDKFQGFTNLLRLFTIFSLACISVIGMSAAFPSRRVRNSVQQRLADLSKETDLDSLKLINQTKAFTVISKEKSPEGVIRLKLRNDYQKRITAFEISIGSTTTLVDTTFSMHDDTIAPGEYRDELLALSIDPELKGRGINILAVVFEDGTADGLVASIREIEDYRLGERMEMDHVGKLLDSISNAPTTALTSVLVEVQSNILSSTPDGAKNQRSIFVQFGVKDTKERISAYIDNIKNDPGATKFNKLLEYSASKSLALKTYFDKIEYKQQ
ncbi:MAG TPA: hypothetical protein VK747_19910 [Blastocatellia bacterium]|nr:hypothetical protein [Blastocatellia bacterium]